MSCNVGKADRIVRVVIGIGIIATGVIIKSWWGAIGIVPLVTATAGWCPLYLPIGLSTCKKEK